MKQQGIRNDWLHIQNAITSVENAGGGIQIHLEEGTYIIGTPKPNLSPTINNQPLLLGSNIHIRGKGIGKTILQICDEANMLAPYLLNDPLGEIRDASSGRQARSLLTGQHVVVHGRHRRHESTIRH